MLDFQQKNKILVFFKNLAGNNLANIFFSFCGDLFIYLFAIVVFHLYYTHSLWPCATINVSFSPKCYIHMSHGYNVALCCNKQCYTLQQNLIFLNVTTCCNI